MARFADIFMKLTGSAEQPGHAPFPWQSLLYDRLVAGQLPHGLDVPTGLGKTAAMACWAAAQLAGEASGHPLPRRLVYVVDRRAIVDQASTEAEKLAKNWSRIAPDRVLHLSTLRGQHFDKGDWVRDPSACAIIVGTVDMIGSRLLFQGYGVSPKMRPVHAGLLGRDTLFLLDEAHLVPPFEALLRSAATDSALKGNVVPPCPGIAVIALSATSRGRKTEHVLSLGDQDREHPVVIQRLFAVKKIEHRSGAKPDDMADAAIGLVADARKLAVFVDRREDAEKVAARLSKVFGADSVLLFTGGRRGWERTVAEADLRRRGFIAGSNHSTQTQILVATSAGEVGVDLDADDAVMDLVAWERIVQRLGRVNRRGMGAARVVICDGGAPDARGADLGACRALLQQVTDAGPNALTELSRAQPDLVRRASTPPPLRPHLGRPEVDDWSLTNLGDHPGRARIAPFLRGWIEEEPRLRLVWRRHLPVKEGDVFIAAEAAAFFEAAPPHLSEVLEIEFGPASGWLKKRVDLLLKQGIEGTGTSTILAMALDRQGAVAAHWTLEGLARLVRDKRAAGDLVGRTLVFDARLGGLTEVGTLDAKAGPPATLDGEDAPPEWRQTVNWIVSREIPETETSPLPETFRLELSEDDGDGPCLVVRAQPGKGADSEAEGRSRGAAVLLVDHTNHVRQHAERVAAALGLSPEDARVLDVAALWHDQGKAAKVWQDAMRAEPGGPYAKTLRGNGHALGRYRHEFGSLLRLQDKALDDLDSDRRDLVLHLIASHHGNARPTLSSRGCDEDRPSALEGQAQDAGLRFARLQRRWGPWGLAWWEAVFRAADRAASEAEQERRHD